MNNRAVIAVTRGIQPHTARHSAAETIDRRRTAASRVLLGNAVLFLMLLIVLALVSQKPLNN
jgi:hypothetical protein